MRGEGDEREGEKEMKMGRETGDEDRRVRLRDIVLTQKLL